MKAEKVAAELQEQVTTKGAAKFLGVSDRTIQNYRKAGILTPHTFGQNNAVLYTKDQLVKVVKRYTVKENYQVNPTRKLVIPNDRFAKKLFNLSD